MHIAAEKGKLDIIELIKNHLNILNPSLLNGWTAFHTAALSGHLRVVEYFIKNGATLDVSIKDENGLGILDLTKKRGHKAIAFFLTFHLMNKAAFFGNLEEVKHYYKDFEDPSCSFQQLM